MPLAAAAEEEVFDPGGAAAPDLLNAETLQEIRGRELGGRMDAQRSREALETFLALPITRYPTSQLLERAWELRHNFTAYDAAYVALAEALEAPLATADGRLARAARSRAGLEVILLS